MSINGSMWVMSEISQEYKYKQTKVTLFYIELKQ